MKKITLTTALLCAGLSACSNSSSDDAISHSITIPFAAEANNVAVDCDTQLTGLGTENSNAQVLDFRFYIHDIALRDAGNNTYPLTLEQNDWQNTEVALLDFTNKDSSCSGTAKQIRTEVSGTVQANPEVIFTGLDFTLGLPSHLNHEDRVTATSPLNISSLHWNWQNGYKFMRLDVAPVGGVNSGSETAWNIHLGSTNCSGDPQIGETVTCTRPNRPEISLDSFDVESDTVLLDYGQLVLNSDLTSNAGHSGCMSGATDPECAALFSQLGMDVATGQADNALTQSVFSIQ